jgi:hypothetical protein
MPSKVLTTFEVLANPIAPGVPDIAYVQQGFFLQITNVSANPTSVEVLFQDTPAFVASKGAIKLAANIIDQTAKISPYPTANFLAAPVGFAATAIPPMSTFLFGVQYLLLPPPPPILTPATGATPQDYAEARGVVSVVAPAGATLVMLATTRQVFTNYSAANTVLDISEGAYSNPLIGGPMHTF